MLATLIIVFREIIEAGLIVGIVLAASKGVLGRSLWVGYGVAAGALGACLVAAFAGQIGSLFQGAGQDLFNATILLLAVVMLTWHNVWMASHGRAMAKEMREVGAAVAAGERPLFALAIVVGVAVLREGSEIVLFLYGIAAAGGASTVSMLIGGVLGLVGGVAVSALMYFGLLAIPARRLIRRDVRADHPARGRPRGAGGRVPATSGLCRGIDRRRCGTRPTSCRKIRCLAGCSTR